jgi:ubiquinone/menaquinone biosynthesis C-methylase UbiE
MTKSLVQRQFGPNAARYRASRVHAEGASLARLVELTRPQPGWEVLDVATGAGHTAAAFAPHVKRVVASDITREMLREAQALARDRGLGNVEFREADAENLAFPDDSFDLVTCRIAPHHFGNVPRFVAEARRVLKPGALFALVDNVAPDAATNPEFPAPALAAAAEEYDRLEKLRDPSHVKALTSAEWRDVFARAGLAIAHDELLPKAMTFAAWCERMSVPAGTQAALRAGIAAASPALRAFFNPREEDGALVLDFMEIMLIGRKPA